MNPTYIIIVLIGLITLVTVTVVFIYIISREDKTPVPHASTSAPPAVTTAQPTVTTPTATAPPPAVSTPPVSTPPVTTAPAPAPAPAPSPRSYVFHPMMDSGGNDIANATDLANNVPSLKSKCDQTPKCIAFNTNGWLKEKVESPSTWSQWTSDPDKGLYILS